MAATEFLNLIRQEILQVIKNEYGGLELATVVSPYPDLMIKIDNMKLELTKDDLMVCERLTRNVRVVSIKSQPGTNRQLGDKTTVDTNSISPIDGIDLSNVQLRFEEVLKPGDRVLVQAIPGGQKYVILDRVIEYG